MPETQAPSAAVRFALETLDLATAGAKAYQRDDLARRLAEARGLLGGGAVRAYVVGEFKQGKSSLVNALLALDVCPVDDDIATAVPTMISYSTEQRAVASYDAVEGDHGSAWSEDIPFDRLGSYVSEGGNPSNTRRLRSVQVGVDRRLLSGGLVVVDTPGVGGLGSVRNSLTASDLPRAHAVLLVSDASQELTDAELRFARAASDLCPTVLFVLTKTDLYPHWRRILELDLEHLSRRGMRPFAVAVSSEFRAAAATSGDRELNDESGFPPLVARLTEVNQDAERVALRAVGAHLTSVIGQLRTTLGARLSALTEPERAAELVTELTRAREQAETLRSASARWQLLLTDGFTDITGDVEFDLRSRARQVLADVEAAIDTQDPGKTWEEIAQALRQQLSALALENYGELTRAVRELAEQVAQHFGLAENQVVRVTEAVAPVELIESMRMGEAKGPTKGKLATGTGLVQQSYSGVMMFSMLRGMAALAIPTPVGLAAGLLMGGSGLITARKQALEQRRGAAKTTVRKFVEEFQLQVGKDARDAVRHAQRDLRNAYTARAEELQRSATEALAAAQAAVKTGQEQQAELAKLRKDLASVATVRARTEQLVERISVSAPAVEPVGGVTR